MRVYREFAGPNCETFSIAPIASFVARWIEGLATIVDPFARNCPIGTIRNDLNPECHTQHHMDAADFAQKLLFDGVRADAVLFDPPYSPRQIMECYQAVGRAVSMVDTQNATLYASVRDPLAHVLRPGGVALSFGWNSTGFGKGRGFIMEEVLIVNHGAAHNDTICVAERKVKQEELF